MFTTRQVLMCQPTHYRVDYQINPWMQVGSVDGAKAIHQWQQLKNTYQSLGLTVRVIEQAPDVPDMVFATDQGLVLDEDTILLSNFRYPERQPETTYYQQWYHQHGYTLQKLPVDIYLEGGDVQKLGQKWLVGTGFRTSAEALAQLSQFSHLPAVELELVDPQFYHLDTCLLVIDDHTLWYYPSAFSSASQAVIQTLCPRVLEFVQDDVCHFAANSVVIDQTIVMHQPTAHFSHWLQSNGYTTLTVDVSEFIKAGGGIHCLTGELGTAQSS